MLAQKLGLSLPTIKKVGGAAAFENLYSIEFIGPTRNIKYSDSDEFTINNSGANRGMSWSFWIKTIHSRTDLFDKFGTSGSEWAFRVGKSGTLEFYIYGNDSSVLSQALITDSSAGSFIDIADGNWHHIVGIYDLGNTSSSLKLYIDNVQFSQGVGALYFSLGSPWIASTNTAQDMFFGGVSGNFKGNADEIAIFDSALSASEVSDIYNSGVPNDVSVIPHLKGWWRNGDPNGTAAFPTIEDESSNSNNGIMNGMLSSDIVTDVP
tara:strand:+ start:638 stop:1432 length:795 start_codon:yes stop_codon:yes gene_type:complete